LRDKGNEKGKKKKERKNNACRIFITLLQYYIIIPVNHSREKFWLAPFASKQL